MACSSQCPVELSVESSVENGIARGGMAPTGSLGSEDVQRTGPESLERLIGWPAALQLGKFVQ
jgi:hypothetical protein